MTAIVVTGFGLVTAAGNDAATVEAALRAGTSGLGPLRQFASPRCGQLPVAEVALLASDPALPRSARLGIAALANAIRGARLGAGELADAGLAVGSTVGGMPETELALLDRQGDEGPRRDVVARHECYAATHAMATAHALGGPCTTISSACSSGAAAIATAADWLRCGMADVMLAGGADALCRLTLNGFASLLAVDPVGCRPFDRRRQGMSLGEGAAFLVLETAAHARAAGREALLELRGFAHSCDAHHATAPDPEGRGAEAAMRRALAMAGAAPGDVDYVNAHGTGTVDNDRAEGRAIARLFAPAPPPVSSTKRVFGHTLAAAGAIEAVACLLAMRRGFLPGSAGFEEADPECRIEPLRATVAAAPRLLLSNSFGFGGNNTVLCFAAAEVR